MNAKWKVPAALFLAVFLISGVSVKGISSDSRWSVHIAMSLLQRGDLNLDEYRTVFGDDRSIVLCIDAAGNATHEDCAGHWHSWYPVGGPVLAAPLFGAQWILLKAASPLLSKKHLLDPGLIAYFRGDPYGGHFFFEIEAASFFLALTAVFVFMNARRFLPSARAVFLTLVFAFGTSAFSTGGRALWQHTPSMLLLSIIVYLLLGADTNPALAAWAGLPVALSYTVRPTDILFVLVFTAYVAVRHRQQLLRYVLLAAPVALVFFAYNFSAYHVFLPPYYRSPLAVLAYPGSFVEALAGNLVSPGRGLLVFTPVFVLSLWSMARGKWNTPLAPWLTMLVVLHWVTVSGYVPYWWAGHAYGPRFFTDLTPVLALFLIPYFAEWERAVAAKVVLVGLALVGIAIHMEAGMRWDVFRWNSTPVDVNRQRIWDWRDLQFLRGLH